jgi:hypothetical protein
VRVQRFQEYLIRLLSECGDPRIASVGTYEIPSVTQPVIRCTDGTEYHLAIVGTAPTGGDDRSQPERIVTREPGTSIKITRR